MSHTLSKFQFKNLATAARLLDSQKEKKKEKMLFDVKTLFPNGQHHPNKQTHKGPFLLPKATQ